MTKAQELLHKLWTKAVGTKDYNKKQWQELESLIIKLEEDSDNSCFECGLFDGLHTKQCWQNLTDR